MTAVRNQSNRATDSVKGIADLNEVIDKYPPRTNHEQLRRDKRITRAIGAVVFSGLMALGVAGFGKAADSIEQETYQPNKTEQESVQRGLQAKQAAEHKPAEQAPEASTPPTSIHTVGRGDTNWGIISEAQEQGQIDPGDIRPRVDEANELNPNLHIGQKVVVKLDHPAE
jgi:hypothetical protein